MTPADRVAARATTETPAAIGRLSRYLAVPAISCDPAHHADVRRLADLVRDELAAVGLDRARVLEVDGALPIVAAEWLKAPGKPTLLVYGHLDLQPVKGEPWHTEPHVATEREGRLYARGAADDMGGWVSHLAAVRAWLEELGELPLNLKLIIEGEEEIGSPNLERYMDAFPDVFASDVMLLTDCENPSTDTPGLTVSLRGLLELELGCEALSADVHSGLWGGMVPDVSVALCRLIARLTDDDGRMAVGRVPVDAARQASGAAMSMDDAIRDGAHLLPGVAPLPTRDRSAAEWMWWQPSLTVVSTTLPTIERKKNALRTKATAILSVRLAPGQTVAEMTDRIRAVVLRDPPAGVRVSLTEAGSASEGWLYTPKGPAFEAADRAYLKSWGKKLVQVGVGGSIPFVALFGRRFGDLPLILNGVMDPKTTAHGPDESLDLALFGKAILANVFLYDELARLSLRTDSGADPG